MEKTSNINLIQSLNYQDYSKEEFNSLNNKLKKTSVISQFSSSWTNPVTRLINGLIYALIGISGIALVYYNLFSLRIGDISAFLTYTNGYTKPFNDISSVIGEYETCKVSLDKINKFLNNECLNIFTNRINSLKTQFTDLPNFKLRIRKMKTRWGVCNKKSWSVTLNSELLKKDVTLIDYVIIHELCHFKHMNHSKDFWKEVEKYYPYHKLARKRLRESQYD